MPLPKDSLLFGFAPKLTEEQKIYVDSMIDNQLTFVNAVSGSGKTTLAVAVAKLLNRDLLYVFSPTEERKLGYSAGTIEDKERKYITPLTDALLEIGELPEKAIISENNIENVKNGNAWVKPMSHIFARGTNIKGNKFLIIDEAQNFTRGDLKKVLSRVHDDVKVVVIGHSLQCDLDNPSKSGFEAYIEHFKNEDYVKVCNLTKNFRGRLSQKADELTW